MSDKVRITPDGIYSIGTAARLLGLSASALRDLERRGKLECTRTPGGQRRFSGLELLQLQEQSSGVHVKKQRPTPAPGAAITADAKARQAWLGQLIARAQRELPVDAPAEVRLRLGADLERALRNVGPAAPLGEIEPVIKREVDQARRQAQQAQELAQRREIKDELLDYAQAHLRRSIESLPTRVVGTPGSLKRRHVRAMLRDQLRDRLQKRLEGDEAWHQVRDLVDEFVAAWYVEQSREPLIPNAVKVLAAGAIGVAGGAAAAAALDPKIRAGVTKLKEPLLLLARDLLIKRATTPSPSVSSPPNPTNQGTPPQPGPSTGLALVRPHSYWRTPSSYRPVVPKSKDAAPEGVTASDAEATHAGPTNRDTTSQESASVPDPTQ
jgi:excisionase family DNA binding protein